MLRNSYQTLKFSGILCLALGMSATLVQTTIAQDDFGQEQPKLKAAEEKARAAIFKQAEIAAKNRALLAKHQQAVAKDADLEARDRAAALNTKWKKIRAEIKGKSSILNTPPVKKTAALEIQEVLKAECERLLVALRQAHLEIELLRRQGTANSKDSITEFFRLKHISSGAAFGTLRGLLNPKSIHMYPVESPSQLLIIRGPQKEVEEASRIIQHLDQPQTKESKAKKTNIPKAIMMRIFIVSDAKDYIEEGENDFAYDLLPPAVCDALTELGFQENKLFIVLQSNTSITINENEPAGFTIQGMPANLFNSQCTFNAQGEVIFDTSNRIHLEMAASTNSMNVKKSHNNPRNQITGSMNAPLGHYLVLGTTNFDTGEPVAARMAYVVQMVEAKSFAPDKPKTPTSTEAAE